MGRQPRPMTPADKRAKLRGEPSRRRDDDSSSSIPGFNIPGSPFNFDPDPPSVSSIPDSPSNPSSDPGFGGGDSGGGGASSDW